MRSIRWKIMLLCAATILAPILLLSRYTIRTFDRFAARDLEEHMIDSAYIVGRQYAAMLDNAGRLDATNRAALDRLVSDYGRETQSRIRVLSTAGVVLADSENPSDAGADLSALPEVATARSGRYRARCALTPDRKYMFYYTALPVRGRDGVVGVAYVSRHTSAIVNTINGLIRFERRVAAGAMAVGIALAAFLAHTITSRLRALTAAAGAFARGEAPLAVRVRGRDEVAELATAVNRMAVEIARTNRYNRDFISTVMHELKMPVTAIKGAAELLAHGAFEKPDARDKFIGNIRFEADRLARMAWELNELTRLDAEVPHAPRERVDYVKCVREILDRFEPGLDAGHAEIRAVLPEKPIPARVIPARIEQVLGNLLDNAVRYTPAGGSIEVRVEPGAGATVVTSVRDTGCGIAASNLGKVFDRFFTTEPKDKAKDYGSGLGLAIAKSIVENHQGRIWVESVPGSGATFFFSLPQAV